MKRDGLVLLDVQEREVLMRVHDLISRATSYYPGKKEYTAQNMPFVMTRRHLSLTTTAVVFTAEKWKLDFVTRENRSVDWNVSLTGDYEQFQHDWIAMMLMV